MAKKLEKSIIADSKKKKDTDNLLESAININHFLLNQFILLPEVSKETQFFLPKIFRANIFLLPELFSDSVNKKDILESSNIL